MRLIIVRHGETEENVSGIVQGHGFGKISEKGEKQIRALALRLKKERIDVVFSSDLDRSAKTAAAIAESHRLRVHYARALRERGSGIFEGQPRENFHAAQIASGLSRLEFRPKGGESLLDLYVRVERFAKRLGREYANQSVLIVTHGWVVKCLMAAYLGIPLKEAAEKRTRNAGVLVIDFGKGGGRIVRSSMFKRQGFEN